MPCSPCSTVTSILHVNITLPAPPPRLRRPFAMSLVSRRTPLALKSCVSATLGSRTPSIVRSSFKQLDSVRTSTLLVRWATYKARATTGTLKPGVYTLQDLVGQPPRQSTETDSLQRDTSAGTQIQLDEQIATKEHPKNYLSRNNEDCFEEVSCPPSQLKSSPFKNIRILRFILTPAKSAIQPRTGTDQALKIRLLRWNPNTYLLSPEEVRSRAILNFVQGCAVDLFDAVLFPRDRLLIDFVKQFHPEARISKQSICHHRTRQITFRHLPITEASEEFVSYVKKTFPDFNGVELYALSGTYVRYSTIHLVHPWDLQSSQDRNT